MTPESIEVARGISELGALVVIAAFAIIGAVLMFLRFLRTIDKLTPAIETMAPAIEKMAATQDRLVARLDKNDYNDKLLRAQAEAVEEEVALLREDLKDHTQYSQEAVEINRCVIDRLETVSEQLSDCLKKRPYSYEEDIDGN